jgi:hypothetical protein
MYESGRPVNRCSTFSPSVITATPAAPATAPCHTDLISRPTDLHPLLVDPPTTRPDQQETMNPVVRDGYHDRWESYMP